MELVIKRFVTGPIETNTYIIIQGKAALLIDPSANCGEAITYCKKDQVVLEGVVITHGHFDHFLGIKEVRTAFPDVKVYAHRLEWPMFRNPDYNGSSMIGTQFVFAEQLHELIEGTMQIGSFTVQIFHIPGHSPGGIAMLIEKDCFVGDSLFAGSIGRSDFPGCDGEALITNVKEKLLALSDDTVAHPGHGGRTTIGRERKSNPFLQ